MRKLIAFCLLGQLSGAAALAEPVKSGDYVAVEGLNLGRWHLAPYDENSGKTLNLRLVPASDTNAQVFLIEKVGFSQGDAIHDGDYVRVRGINSDYNNGRDPYLMVEGNGVERVNVNDKSPSLGMNDPTILFIRSSQHDISFGTPFKIRGTHAGDNWFVHTSNQSMVGFTQNDGAADTFYFEEPNRQMMKDDLQISDHSHPPGPFSQFIGWVINRLSVNNERPRCGYFNSCNPNTTAPPLNSGNPSTGGEPTLRTWEPGSAIHVYIANPTGRRYRCTVRFRYRWDSFGDIQSDGYEGTSEVDAYASEREFGYISGSFVNLELIRPIEKQCNVI